SQREGAGRFCRYGRLSYQPTLSFLPMGTKNPGIKNKSHHLPRFPSLLRFWTIASGCDVVTVQRAMGHKSPSVTLDTYSHMWPDAADRTRAAVGGLMKDVFSSHEDQVRTKNLPSQV